MSNTYKEYQQPSVGQSKCTYSTLPRTYNGMTPLSQSLSQDQYIVPSLCPNASNLSYPPSYDTLSHGQGYLCGGYFSLQGAYPNAGCGLGNCKATYVSRPCDGFINCASPQAPPSTLEKFCYK